MSLLKWAFFPSLHLSLAFVTRDANPTLPLFPYMVGVDFLPCFFLVIYLGSLHFHLPCFFFVLFFFRVEVALFVLKLFFLLLFADGRFSFDSIYSEVNP